MKKIVIVLLVVGVLAFLGLKYWSSSGGVSDQLTPPVSSTENWETYSNPLWGVSFDYPADWELVVVADGSDGSFLSLTLTKEDTSQEKIEVYTESIYPTYTIQFMAKKNDKGFSAVEEYTSQFINPPEDTYDEVIYGGLEGVKYNEPIAPSSGLNPAVLLASDANLYNLVHSAMATSATHTKYVETFEKVLASLKFE
jgi:hypothetical protein